MYLQQNEQMDGPKFAPPRQIRPAPNSPQIRPKFAAKFSGYPVLLEYHTPGRDIIMRSEKSVGGAWGRYSYGGLRMERLSTWSHHWNV